MGMYIFGTTNGFFVLSFALLWQPLLKYTSYLVKLNITNKHKTVTKTLELRSVDLKSEESKENFLGFLLKKFFSDYFKDQKILILLKTNIIK